MVAVQDETKRQKSACPREEYQLFCARNFGSGTAQTVQSYQKDDTLKKELREKFHAACDSFGFDTVDAPYDPTAARFAQNKILCELYNVRPKAAGDKSGACSTAHRSGVTYDEGLACAAVVEHFKFQHALEIGLAYGHSALFTACALPAEGTLVAIDPVQATDWMDKGAQVVRDCQMPHGGHAKFTCLYEKDTVALPRLVEQGKVVQFAFIDGLHTFDYTLVDAFYIDQMLEVGGVLAFDDIGYPTVQKAILYFLANRSYRLLHLADPKFAPATFWRVMFLQKVKEDDPVGRDGARPGVPAPLFTF